ncbi:hypothetical protein ACIBJI_40185 [Nocardia sp. NPDC050408]|uniref:hypothetical protein n=1 Tax=Nocardia sp. NPDC050408 TaxID=3364319 RepID=UPI0037922BA8
MRRVTGLECLCGAELDEVDTDDGIAMVCRECGTSESWLEHITESTTPDQQQLSAAA